MGKFNNSKKESFLDSIPTTSLDSDTDKLTLKCKFNFGYFNRHQDAGQDFSDWDRNELTKLLNKLTNYSEGSLDYWKTQTSGNHSIFSVYDFFPQNSDFEEPKTKETFDKNTFYIVFLDKNHKFYKTNK